MGIRLFSRKGHGRLNIHEENAILLDARGVGRVQQAFEQCWPVYRLTRSIVTACNLTRHNRGKRNTFNEHKRVLHRHTNMILLQVYNYAS